MVSSRKHWKQFFRWTTPKGFAAIVLFLIIAFFTEYLLVNFFLSMGLTDRFLFRKNFQVPSTSLFFTITISPLFHLIPLGVIVVLVTSWMQLTKHLVTPSHRKKTITKRQLLLRKRQYSRAKEKSFKPIRSFLRGIKKKFRRVNRVFKRLCSPAAKVLRIRYVLDMLQQLLFTKAALKSTLTILAVFIGSFFSLFVLGYPRLIYDVISNFYANNPLILEFVLRLVEKVQAIGQNIFPIGWLASNINNMLVAVALVFRNTLKSFGTSIVEPIERLELVWKYALYQNVAAWISATSTLVYSKSKRFFNL